ncbi:MAG: FlgO family outer membrane protein [Acidobacteria bacterium]|nr:FlgO family outer membrane protein [Acidobacteriota bacterium]
MRTAIGRYRVKGLLGEGGMGVVYAAHDDQLDRPVAIKMLREASADEEARERLRREARATAKVSHPNICQLYEIAQDEEEMFLIMEHLEGESLEARVARGALPASDALKHLLALLSALSATHARGLVHRDLKPSNVFLTPDGVKLLDFGIARAAESDADRTHVALTQPGVVLGTPQFASPEQFTGAPVDARTDVFAAGNLLYFMLAGKPMFSGKTVLQLFHAVQHEHPPVLGGSAAIAAADRIIHRSVAKAPADRYQSCAEMTADVRAALLLDSRGAPASAIRMTRLIVLPFRVLRPDAETDFLAFSLPDAITTSLTGLGSLVVRSSVTASQVASETNDLGEIAAKADVDIVLTGTLVRAGDRVRVNAQLVEGRGGTVLWSEAAQVSLDDVFQVQDDLSRRIVDSLSVPLTAHDRRVLGKDVPADGKAYELYLRGNQLSEQAKNWTQARDAYRACLDLDPRYAPAWARLGRIYRVLGIHGESVGAEAAIKRALELNPDLSVAHNLYTNLEVEVGRGPDAMRRLLTRAADNPGDPELFAGLVQACRYSGLLRASVAAYERAARLDTAIKTSVAHSYLALGDYQRAVETSVEDPAFPKAWALDLLGRKQEALDTLHHTEADGLPKIVLRYVLAARAVIEGRRDDAKRINLNLLHVSPPRDPCTVFYLARHLAAVGDVANAEIWLRRAIERGFNCFDFLTRDPWLAAVRSSSHFQALVRLAQDRRAAALNAFHDAGGEQVLGLETGQ